MGRIGFQVSSSCSLTANNQHNETFPFTSSTLLLRVAAVVAGNEFENFKVPFQLAFHWQQQSHVARALILN